IAIKSTINGGTQRVILSLRLESLFDSLAFEFHKKL
ncbi:unnamed protein product, partial [Brassica rapa subsp. narinosa]